LRPVLRRSRIINMSQKLHHLFKNIKELDPTERLEGLILQKIELERGKNVRNKLVFSYIGLISSTLAVFYTLLAFGQTLLRSEFWNILSLAFSDAGIVLANWHDYLYSAMETFPVLTVAIILLPIFILLMSIDFYLNLSHKNNFKHIHHGMCA
jgi:hypothetical protein